LHLLAEATLAHVGAARLWLSVSSSLRDLGHWRAFLNFAAPLASDRKSIAAWRWRVLFCIPLFPDIVPPPPLSYFQSAENVGSCRPPVGSVDFLQAFNPAAGGFFLSARRWDRPDWDLA
jgi:hypothetical protein